MELKSIRQAGIDLASKSTIHGIEYALQVLRQEVNDADFIEDALGRVETKLRKTIEDLS